MGVGKAFFKDAPVIVFNSIIGEEIEASILKIYPEIIYLSGSVELAPLVGLADAIVDISETGETIKKNNLKIVSTIQEVSCKFIVNKSSQKTLGDKINSLASALTK